MIHQESFGDSAPRSVAGSAKMDARLGLTFSAALALGEYASRRSFRVGLSCHLHEDYRSIEASDSAGIEPTTDKVSSYLRILTNLNT